MGTGGAATVVAKAAALTIIVAMTGAALVLLAESATGTVVMDLLVLVLEVPR